MDLSVIIPVYNEEAILRKNTKELLDYLEKQKLQAEIIICSNGSTDSTDKIGRELEEKNDQVKFLRLEEKGVGLAFKEMVRNASSEKIISLDMDLSIDLDFIPRAYEELDRNAMVLGSKKMGNQDRSFFRLLASETYIMLVRLFLGLSYKDYSIAAKGYRKNKILDFLEMIDHGSSYVVEICYLLKEQNEQIVEIPVTCEDTRESKFNIYKEAVYRLKNLLSFFLRVKI